MIVTIYSTNFYHSNFTQPSYSNSSAAIGRSMYKNNSTLWDKLSLQDLIFINITFKQNKLLLPTIYYIPSSHQMPNE